jgi:hypothetical protein
MEPGEHRSGIAETFDEARAGFQAAWQELAATRSKADYKAWRKLVEIAAGIEPVLDGRIHIEKINAPFLYSLKASGEEFGAGIRFAIEQGWLELHESGTYVRLLSPGEDLLAKG